MTLSIDTLNTWLSDGEWPVGLLPWIPAAFVVIGVWVIWIRILLRRRTRSVDDRLTKIRGTDGDTHLEQSEGVFGALTPALAAQIPESRKESRDFAQLLRSAGIYSRTARTSIYAARLLALLLPLVIGGALAVWAPAESTWRIMIIAGLVAAGLSIMPRLYVFFRRRRRVRQIRHGLADMMDMLSMCTDGGLTLTSSLEHVSRNLTGYPALAEELAILTRQSDVSSLEPALADFAARIDLPEVRQVAGLLARNHQLGSRLAGSLLDQADHFRTARRQLATMQANKTPVKLTLPLLFCFAPAALVLLLSPAMLELNDFLYPRDGQSILAGNETLNTDAILRTLDQLDQDLTIPPSKAP